MTGVTICDDPIDSSDVRCDQQYVIIRPGEYIKGLACHETGHAVGMLHGDETAPIVGLQGEPLICMKKTVSQSAYLSLEEKHNITHVYG